MTCIVGLVHEGVVYIGGDSAGVGGMSLTVRADEKVFQNGEFLMGFTTSFRMGQLLRYSLKPPRRHPDDDIHQYMVVDFINAVRECLKSGGYASKKNDVESGGTFLVGLCWVICSPSKATTRWVSQRTATLLSALRRTLPEAPCSPLRGRPSLVIVS